MSPRVQTIAGANGRTKAQIRFLIGNDPAERSYLKAGCRLAEEKRPSGFEPLTGAAVFKHYERET